MFSYAGNRSVGASSIGTLTFVHAAGKLGRSADGHGQRLKLRLRRSVVNRRRLLCEASRTQAPWLNAYKMAHLQRFILE
jgi:hypothetical protein